MIDVIRTNNVMLPDPTRVVARPFFPGSPNFGGAATRLELIAKRVAALSPGERRELLDAARNDAAGHHRDIDAVWERHVAQAATRNGLVAEIPGGDMRTLLGAYLTQSYAYEAAALTNPSIVPLGEPDPAGHQRFVMSLRAIGEGHISSIAFVSGHVAPDGAVHLDPRSPFVSNGDRVAPIYDKAAFGGRLAELGIDNDLSRRVLAELPRRFTAGELDASLARAAETDLEHTLGSETRRRIHWLAASNYVLRFGGRADISERLISPAGPAESRGMEDARFVRFVEGNRTIYYATYTAFDGVEILPQLIRTKDFSEFRISTMSGPMAQHKGMALFPRKVGGVYLALSRHDNESTFVLRTDDLRVWRTAERAFGPRLGWEVVQGGNCGSPMETPDGWLVITHGVGPMRRYVLGAVLLDLDEPTRVVARLTEPLIEPLGRERFGYVPDVVYSCGSLIHGDWLVVPFGFADTGVEIAVTRVADVIGAMR